MYKKTSGPNPMINCFWSVLVSFCFFLHFFLNISLEQLITRSKLLLRAVFFWPSNISDSSLQLRVNINSIDLNCYFFSQRKIFLTYLQQESFYIYRFIFSIFKLVATLEMQVNHWLGRQKNILETLTLQHFSCQKHKTWSFFWPKLRDLVILFVKSIGI